jgi:hypothetical protein
MAVQENAKGRKKSPGSAVLVAVGVTLSGIASSSYANIIVNGNPQEISDRGCYQIQDPPNGTNSASFVKGTGCVVGTGTGASKQGDPGSRAIFYSSSGIGTDGINNTLENSLNLGGYLDVRKAATFWAGADMQNTKVTNLASGDVSAASKEGINGSQLYNTASSTAAVLGGGSSVDAAGKISKPTYNVAGNTYSDVGTALAAVDSKAASGSADGVKYDTSAHDKVTFNGAAGTTLSNVNAGAVSAMSKEAVNGSQLYTLAASAASALGGGSAVNSDGSISKPEYTVGGNTVSGVDGAVNALDTRITDATASAAQNRR